MTVTSHLDRGNHGLLQHLFVLVHDDGHRLDLIQAGSRVGMICCVRTTSEDSLTTFVDIVRVGFFRAITPVHL